MATKVVPANLDKYVFFEKKVYFFFNKVYYIKFFFVYLYSEAVSNPATEQQEFTTIKFYVL